MSPAESRALRAGQILAPLFLLPIAMTGLMDPAFANSVDIDEPWEALCFAVSGLGLVLRVLVAAHERPGAWRPHSRGLYSLVRHPLALGNFLIWAGLALFPRSWPSACAGLAVAALLCARGMATHDAWLRRHVGPWFDNWRRSTPAVIPRWSSWNPPASGFSWRAVLDRESGTLLATMAGFLLLEVVGDLIIEPEPRVRLAWAVMVSVAAVPYVLSRLLAWQARAAAAVAPSSPAAIEQDRWLVLLVVAFAGLVAWDSSGADLAFADWFAGPHGFTWRNHPVFADVLHTGGRLASWMVVGWMAWGIARPTGELRMLPRRDRVWLLATVVASVLLVTLIKMRSSTTCPWDLADFGGSVPYVSHLHLHLRDGGAGHCFPGGHAAGGFALVAGFFAFRRRAPRTARQWLLVAFVFGTVLGVGQQARGAHFTSHTLWTAWFCCAVAWGSARLFLRERGARQ